MIPVGALVGLTALWLLLSVKVLSEYEWGIIFRFGNLLPRARGRGLVLVAWPIERMVRVSLRTIALRIPSQDLIAAGATTVKADAVVYFRVTDPLRTRVQVENHLDTPTLEVQPTLPTRLGQDHIDGLMSERDRLRAVLQEVIDQHTERATSAVSEVAVKAVVDLPPEVLRVIAKQAESAPEGRAGPGRPPSEPLEVAQSPTVAGAREDSPITFQIPFEWMKALLGARDTSAYIAPGQMEWGDGP